jgi:hypothetical protein
MLQCDPFIHHLAASSAPRLERFPGTKKSAPRSDKVLLGRAELGLHKRTELSSQPNSRSPWTLSLNRLPLLGEEAAARLGASRLHSAFLPCLLACFRILIFPRQSLHPPSHRSSLCDRHTSTVSAHHPLTAPTSIYSLHRHITSTTPLLQSTHPLSLSLSLSAIHASLRPLDSH